MAINVTMNALGAMKKLDVNAPLLQWLEGSGIDVKLTAKAFTFSVPGTGLTPLQVAVTLDELQKLNAGKLEAGKAALLRVKLGDAIGTLQAYCAEMKWGSSGPEPVSEAPKKPTLAALPPLEGSAKPAAVKAWPKFEVSKLKTAAQVKLRDATMMYQPVLGTSSGSRYFMVAASKDLRIAARYEGGSLSVRIEGPSWEKHKTAITQCGFNTIDTKKGYASLHLAVPNHVMASKTLGAVLLGLGVQIETPIPDLMVIKS